VTSETRLFRVADFIQPSEDLPIRSVVLETPESVIVVWYVNPGQEIAAHVHPYGQDTWTILSGTADYFQGDGKVSRIKTNDITVAKPNQVHGARTVGNSPFIFVSVVAPGGAGYALADK
jgi:quercetin dioxygenase-like cupin family protein